MAASAGVESFSKIQRLVLGVSVLVFVNVLSVLATVVDRRLFPPDLDREERPFFVTFLKAAVCSVYLSGFLFLRGWRDQCRSSTKTTALIVDDEAGPDPDSLIRPNVPEYDPQFSEPHYVPIKFDAEYCELSPHSDDERVVDNLDNWYYSQQKPDTIPSHIWANIAPDYCQKPIHPPSPPLQTKDRSRSPPALISKLKRKGHQIRKTLAQDRGVRFKKWTEVRVLNETYAEAAVLARMSYQASLRMQALFRRAASQLTLVQVLKVSFIFSLLWFMAHLASAEAQADAHVPLVQVMFSSSGLFTLILAAVFPSSNHDKFTLSKLVAVLSSIGGSVLVCLPMLQSMPSPFPLRTLWAIAAAFLFSTSVVYFQRQAENEDRLNIPLFLGFVGLFAMLLMWPGFFVAKALNAEAVVWPSRREWLQLSVSIIVCTFVTEVLWLWGCLLTSSLVATSALSLQVPLNVMASMTLNQLPYTWFIYVGSLPISLAFLATAAFSYYDSWDPVFIALKKLVHCIFRARCCCCCCTGREHRKTLHGRSREHDKEQKESLILNEQKCASS